MAPVSWSRLRRLRGLGQGPRPGEIPSAAFRSLPAAATGAWDRSSSEAGGIRPPNPGSSHPYIPSASQPTEGRPHVVWDGR